MDPVSRLYAGFTREMPMEWKAVGVAEPIDYRREACVKASEIPPENVFTTWEYVFERPKLADVAVFTTQDAMHLGPALAALDRGYDLLLEKPIANSWDACRQIHRKVQATGAIVRMVRDLVQAVSQRRQDLISTTLQASVESHLMGFLAEESRVAGGAVRPVALDL